ncbi:hypothetical protein [Nitrospira sp. Nam80]
MADRSRRQKHFRPPEPHYFFTSLFVRFPPDRVTVPTGQPRKFPKLDLVTDLKDGSDFWFVEPILDAERRYRVEHDPLALIEAFVHAVRAGVYPDVSILREIANRFRLFLDAKGAKDLDSAFGLTNGRGSWSPFTMKANQSKQRWLARQIFALTAGFNFSIEEASERVAGFLKRDNSGRKYTAKSLQDLYSRRWKKQFKLDESDPSNLDNPNNTFGPWTQAYRDSFLLSFRNPDFDE